MAYGSMTMEERLKEHIKEYSLENLLDLSLVKACFEDISKVLGIELLLTQRHGETAVEVGNFAGFTQAWLSIEDPKDQADIYIKAAKFVIPALQSVDVSGSLKTDKSIEQQLLELSKKE